MKKTYIFISIIFASVFGGIHAQNDSCFLLPELVNSNPDLTAVLDSVIAWTDCLPSDESKLYRVYSKDTSYGGINITILYFRRTSWFESSVNTSNVWMKNGEAWFFWEKVPDIPLIALSECIGTREINIGDFYCIIEYLPTVVCAYSEGEFWILNICGWGQCTPPEKQFPIHIQSRSQ